MVSGRVGYTRHTSPPLIGAATSRFLFPSSAGCSAVADGFTQLSSSTAGPWLPGACESPAVEAPRSQERRVEYLRAVGRRQEDHAGAAVEAVHLDEQLIERLLLFVMAAAKGIGAAGAAHHLNNLLAVILGRIQITLRRHQETEIARSLRPAEQAALDGAEVVKRLARFSRGNPEPAIVPIDLNELVEDVVEMTRPRWQNELESRGIRVETVLELGTIPLAAADPPSIREVLVNLILNAVDAMPAGGRVAVRTWTTAGGVHCAVSDTGTGMSAEVRRRVFEPFFTTKGVKSTGLGLSVNYGIIQRHGGELTVDTEEGRGTTITFRLPIAHDRPRAAAGQPVADAVPLRVLLIDDDGAVRAAVAELLAEDGHQVTEAAGGPEGLARLASGHRVDLVLTDLGMLGMNGWDVARAVRSAYPATVVGLMKGVIPQTLNFRGSDPECDLDYCHAGKRASDATIAMSNSFAFGGNITSLVIGKS